MAGAPAYNKKYRNIPVKPPLPKDGEKWPTGTDPVIYMLPESRLSLNESPIYGQSPPQSENSPQHHAVQAHMWTEDSSSAVATAAHS